MTVPDELEGLTVMAAWFMAQLLLAKKMYMTIVIAKDMVYIPRVDPMSTPRQARESLSSIFCRQYSAQVCARSTSKIKPKSTNSMASMSAKYFPQTWKNASGMKKVITTNANQRMIFGPQ